MKKVILQVDIPRAEYSLMLMEVVPGMTGLVTEQQTVHLWKRFD
jgi:hypothetical protein